MHVPQDANIVLVEYAVNDRGGTPNPPFDNPDRWEVPSGCLGVGAGLLEW